MIETKRAVISKVLMDVHLRPWKPSEAEACRRKWEVMSR